MITHALAADADTAQGLCNVKAPRKRANPYTALQTLHSYRAGAEKHDFGGVVQCGVPPSEPVDDRLVPRVQLIVVAKEQPGQGKAGRPRA